MIEGMLPNLRRSRKHLLPSIAAYFANHLWSEVPACGDSRGFADGVVNLLKVSLRCAFNLACSVGFTFVSHPPRIVGRFPPKVSIVS